MADIEVEKDYARKQYRTNKAYPEFIRTVTQKSIWDSVTSDRRHLAEFSGIEFDSRDPLVKAYERFLKQSEMKKPYRSDSYQAMEQDAQPNDPYAPPFDVVNPLVPNPDRPFGGDGPGSAFFNFDASGGWCENEERILRCTTSEPCYLVQITYTSSDGVTINGSSSAEIPGVNEFDLTIYVPTGYRGMVTLEAIMVSFEGISGDSNDNIFEARDCCDCDEFEWAPGNPSTISQDDSVVIEVDGTCDAVSSYSWEFEAGTGDGFSFGSPITTNPINTLETTVAACGSAWIKVTDGNGCEAFGSIRCVDSGQWYLECETSGVDSADEDSCCYLKGEPDSINYYAGDHAYLTKTGGGGKQINTMFFQCGCTVGGGRSLEQCEEDLASCNWPSRCSTAPCNNWHCPGEECLTHPEGINTSLCSTPSDREENDTDKINPAFYLGQCYSYIFFGDTFYKGRGISPCCEYHNEYWTWGCPP